MNHKNKLLKGFAAVLDRMEEKGFSPMAIIGVNETRGIFMVPLPNQAGECLPIENIEEILLLNFIDAERKETEPINVNTKQPFGTTEN